MNLVAAVWIVVGVVTLLVLAAFMISLVRQVQRLSGSVVEFQREVRPVLESIQRDAQAAAEHSEIVQQKAEGIRDLRASDERDRSGGARSAGADRSRARARR